MDRWMENLLKSFCTNCINRSHFCCTSLTFGSWLSSVPTGLTSSVRVCSQLPSRANSTKESPIKQSSARGNSFLLANGSGWQHQSSTMAFQLPLGRGRTRLNTLKKRKNNKKKSNYSVYCSAIFKHGANWFLSQWEVLSLNKHRDPRELAKNQNTEEYN